MYKNDLVSIIVPVYNVQSYLTDCVNSLINQTYKNLEIILIDDGSSDSCPIICDNFAKKDNRIKVIHKENGGLSDARNKGIEIATGNFITFVDSDDYVNNNMIDVMIKSLSSNAEECISVCTFKEVYSFENYSFPENIDVKPISYNELSLTSFCVTAWGKLYPKSLFNDIKFPVCKLHEDIFTTYLLFEKVKDISFINEPLYYYRQRKNSITSNLKFKNFTDTFEGLFQRLSYFENKSNTFQTKKTLILLSDSYVDLKTKKKLIADFSSEKYRKLCTNVKCKIILKNKKYKISRVTVEIRVPCIYNFIRYLKHKII